MSSGLQLLRGQFPLLFICVKGLFDFCLLLSFWVPPASIPAFLQCSQCFLHWAALSAAPCVFSCTLVALVGQGRGWMKFRFFIWCPQINGVACGSPLFCALLFAPFYFSWLEHKFCISEWRGIVCVPSKRWMETNKLIVHFGDLEIGSFDARGDSNIFLQLHCGPLY